MALTPCALIKRHTRVVLHKMWCHYWQKILHQNIKQEAFVQCQWCMIQLLSMILVLINRQLKCSQDITVSSCKSGDPATSYIMVGTDDDGAVCLSDWENSWGGLRVQLWTLVKPDTYYSPLLFAGHSWNTSFEERIVQFCKCQVKHNCRSTELYRGCLTTKVANISKLGLHFNLASTCHLCSGIHVKYVIHWVSSVCLRLEQHLNTLKRADNFEFQA